MKKNFIILPLVALLVYIIACGYSEGPAYLGGVEGTGASGSAGCSCHNSTSTSTTAITIQLLDFGSLVTTYSGTGSHSYTIRMTGTQTSTSLTLPRFGFQLAVVTSATGGSSGPTNAGTLSAISGTHTWTTGGVNLVEHYLGAIPATTGSGGSGTTYVVNLPWTAPSAGTGNVTIYGVINAVNFNGSDDAGDKWNNTSQIIYESVGAITGTTSTCMNATTTLSCTPSGGTWSSGTSGVATVGSTGVVTGAGSGTATISYNAGGSGIATVTVTVFAAPTAPFGTTSYCPGGLGTLGDITPAGTWSSGNTSVALIGVSSGSVTAVSAGTSLISYTTSTHGCFSTLAVTVNPNPNAITGGTTICNGGSTAFADATTGGTWASSNTSAATIGSSGTGAGVALGTSTLTYKLGTGCYSTLLATVVPSPASITGTPAVCEGGTTLLGSTSSGGTWASSSGSATAGSGGLITGVVTGTSVISYSLAFGCATTTVVTVNPTPPAISGGTTVCDRGGSSTLSDFLTGGSWASSNTAVATVGSGSGTITGITAGSAIITYMLPTGCYNTTSVLVNPSPPAISGTLAICAGSTSSLSDAGSGTWLSSNTSVATVDFSSGVLTGVNAGTSLITYTVSSGCFSVATATVYALPLTLSGPANVCAGSNVTFTDAVIGGQWSSSNTLKAIVGSGSGIITGVSAGSATITYAITTTGCYQTKPINVFSLPAAISGPAGFCAGTTASLADATGFGTWASSNTGVATVGSTSGVATGVASGTSIITFTYFTTGCMATRTETVFPGASAILGTRSTCVGTSTTLTDGGTGTWASSNTNTTVGSTSGTVTGVTAGISAITYTLSSSGCAAVASFTVLALPPAISGTGILCAGSTTSLSDGAGTWASGTTSVATISSTGLVSGVSGGTSIITFSVATGCMATKVVTVNPAPSGISGTSPLCAGTPATFTDTDPGGTWASSNTAVASIGSSSGDLTALAGGTTTITYKLATGCITTKVVTVSPITSISGLSTICAGNTTSLTDGITGGTWASSNTAVATITTSTGLLAALTAGTTVITYVLPTGCAVTSTVTVVLSPTGISGNRHVCIGTADTLSDVGGGLWTSSATTVATIGSGTGVVTGVGSGTSLITFSLGTGCAVSAVVTVTPSPVAISGTSAVCAGASISLTDGTSGGSWSSSNSNATALGGLITGNAAGTAVISYTLGTGCAATKVVTINAAPAAINGTAGICPGFTAALTDSLTGGTWSSSNAGVATVVTSTGVLTGVSSGTSNITYVVAGCHTIAVVTVNPLPSAILGTAAVCETGTTTLSDGGSGTWAASNTNVNISTTGDVTGLTAGLSIITYTLPTGCMATRIVTVNPLPSGISGALGVCAGTTTTLSDGTGTWASGSTAVATIGSSTGSVTAVSLGTSTITFTLGTGCSTTSVVTVNPLPSAIAGRAGICVGATATLTDTTSGGVWSSSNTNAAIDSVSGIVTAAIAGTSHITYTLPTGCAAVVSITVNALPLAIGGAGAVCVGSATGLTDATAGGIWGSSNTSVATAGSSGTIAGIAQGTAIITYTLSTGCLTTATMTVNPVPAAITGTLAMCAGASNTLTSTTTGGLWSSGRLGVATIGSATGSVAGVSAGTAAITYALGTGCMATAVATINALPNAIAGAAAVCVGSNISLTDVSAGGSWVSGNTTVATVGSSSGTVSGVLAGSAIITYTLTTGCLVTSSVLVNTAPGSITGTASVCVSATTSLGDATAGGTWASSATGIAAVGSTGSVAGVASGTANITYTLSTGCSTIVMVTVNPMPTAGTITGTALVCAGSSTPLADATGGGAWSSSNTSVATVGTTGVVSGVAFGLATITYSVTNGCGTTRATITATVIALPATGSIVGADSVCEGDTLRLTDPTTAGIWASTDGTVATVDGTGLVTAVAPGFDTIKYSVTTPCGTATARLLLRVKSTAECNTGVRQVQAMPGVKIYPVPSAGTFSIEMPATQQGATITVTDLLGKTIATKTTNGAGAQTITIELKNVASGSYIVKIDAGDAIYRQKITLLTQ